IEYGHEAQKAGISGIKRIESLNDDPMFIEAMANIVKDHLNSNKSMSTQLTIRCPKCKKDICQETRDFFTNQ
ncbi:1209_t:CDS:2, partial [Entrophospora sp. SA101]